MPLYDPSLGTNPEQYSALLTSTLQNFQPQLVDNFSDATPFNWCMTQNGRKRHLRGGTNIEVPLMYSGSEVQAFDGYDRLETEPVEGMAPATFLWKKYTVPIVISKDHETDNMSESAIIDLVSAKVKQAEISFREELNNDLINNGLTGASEDASAVPNSMRVVGLTDICQNATQARPYGGIAGDTYTWWVNQYEDVTSVFSTYGVDAMRTCYLNCSRGNDAPDLILCSQDVFELYEATLVSDKRFVNTNAADAGFESLMFRGCKIMFDRDVMAASMFFLNTNYLTLYVHPDVDMAPTPFREAENQWARYSRIFWKGALTCSNRARQGLLTNLVVA